MSFNGVHARMLVECIYPSLWGPYPSGYCDGCRFKGQLHASTFAILLQCDWICLSGMDFLFVARKYAIRVVMSVSGGDLIF